MARVASITFCARASCRARRMAALKSNVISLVPVNERRSLRRSPDAIGERGLDVLAGVECAEDGDGVDRRSREFGRAVIVDRRKADDLDTKPFAFRLRRLQLLAAEASEAEFEGVPHDRLLDGVGVGGELVADRCPDEVGAVGIEAFAHQKIDMAEVDEADVDRDLLALALPVRQSVNHFRHGSTSTIRMDGIWMVMGGLQEADRPTARTRRASSPMRSSRATSCAAAGGLHSFRSSPRSRFIRARNASSLAPASSTTCSSLFIARVFSIGAASGPAG